MIAAPKQDICVHDIVAPAKTFTGRPDMQEESRAAALKKVAQVIDRLRHESDKFPSKRIAVFLVVGAEEGLAVEEIAARAGIPQQSASKHLHDLGELRDDKTMPGMKLVEHRQDRMNLSKKNIYLTKNGLVLIDHLVRIMGGRQSQHDNKA